jgi:hypothetical protein
MIAIPQRHAGFTLGILSAEQWHVLKVLTPTLTTTLLLYTLALTGGREEIMAFVTDREKARMQYTDSAEGMLKLYLISLCAAMGGVRSLLQNRCAPDGLVHLPPSAAR